MQDLTEKLEKLRLEAEDCQFARQAFTGPEEASLLCEVVSSIEGDGAGLEEAIAARVRANDSDAA